MNTSIQKMSNTIQNTKIDELSLNIIELVSKYPFEAFTIDKINDLISKDEDTSYATIYRKIETLVEQGILTKSMYGMASQIKINLKNEKTISLLSLIEANNFEKFFRKLKGNLSISISEIIKDTIELSDVKCVLIFGSYAKGTQIKESDLDILVIEEPSKAVTKKNYETYLKAIRSSMMGILKTSELRGGPKINPIIIINEEHREMILNKENNVAKEVLLNHIILKGHRSYWEEIARCIHVK